MGFKPIKTETFLIEHLLCVLAGALTIVGFIFSEFQVTFWPAAFGYLHQGDAPVNQTIISLPADWMTLGLLRLGDIQVSLDVGIVPFANLCYFISFLLIYLLYEFYGFKKAIYTAFSLAVAISLLFGFFQFVQTLQLESTSGSIANFGTDKFEFSPRDVYSVVAALLTLYISSFSIASFLRKMTSNYFMFLRFTVSASVGFLLFVASRLSLAYFNQMAPESLFVFGFTPYIQFLLGTIISIIPLYFLRFFLGIFRGSDSIKIDTSATATKKIFVREESESELKTEKKEPSEKPVVIFSAPSNTTQSPPEEIHSAS